MRVCVIGGGIVGLSTAAVLQEQGADVTVIDGGAHPGCGASAANGAQLSYSYVQPLAEPSVWGMLPGLLLRPNSPLAWRPSLSPGHWRWCWQFLAACRAQSARASTVVREAGRQTTITTAYIFAIMIGATAFSLVLRGLGGDELIAQALKSLPFGPTGIVVAILLFTFVLGFFLDWIEITLIVLPLVLPVVKSLGFDPVWFTVVFAVVLQSSFLTPPVGFSLFYLKGVAPPEVRTTQIYRGIVPFNVMIFVMVLLCFWVKDFVLWLPKVAYGN